MKCVANSAKTPGLILRPYPEQLPSWPRSGRHIMAQFDADSIIVYQAYKPSIARFAVEHQQFGGDFSYSRMSWIKPNFLWMMFRSSWATKEGQEHILAVRLKRAFFDELLEASVPSTFDANRFPSLDEWHTAVANSEVRLQWDPDHDPCGHCLERRAVQLGLRGKMLQRYGQEELLSIEDITGCVIEQRQNVQDPPSSLLTPLEEIYLPSGRLAMAIAGMDEDSRNKPS
jgi:hypothetical protein